MIPLFAHVTLSSDWFDGASAGLLLLRVAMGLTLAAHGYNKFFGGGGISGTAGWFDSMGMKPGKLNAYMAASTEMGAGILFALGLLTPLAAAGFVGLMAVAGYTVHRKNGFFIVKSGWEYNFILALVPVCVAMVGPGRYSLDWAIGFDFAFEPWLAFAIAAGLGIGGGLAQLAAFYRPPADKS